MILLGVMHQVQRRVFWLCISAMAATAVMAAAFFFVGWHPFWIFMAVLITCSTFGSRNYHLIVRSAVVWDKAAAAYARLARVLIRSVCYVCVLCPAALCGSRLPDKTNGRGWQDAAVDEHFVELTRRNGRFQIFRQLIRRKDRCWILAVLPYFLLAQELKTDNIEKEELSIYTLF